MTKRHLSGTILLLILNSLGTNSSSAQVPDSYLQNEANYRIVDTTRVGEDKGTSFPRFILTYQLIQDPNYEIRKFFRDSTQTNLLSIGHYYKNLVHGEYTKYNGKRYSVSSWTKGILNGPSIDYYEKGKVFIRGNYKDGLEDGTWIFYDTQGKIYQKIVYKKGAVLKTTGSSQ
jgi:hypothetical protein